MVILTSLGTWGLPQMVQKFYAIKNEESIKKGTIISTLFALVVAGGCYFLGGFGRLFSDQVDVAAQGYDSIIPDQRQHRGYSDKDYHQQAHPEHLLFVAHFLEKDLFQKVHGQGGAGSHHQGG